MPREAKSMTQINSPKRFYHNKYSGVVWVTIIAALLVLTAFNGQMVRGALTPPGPSLFTFASEKSRSEVLSRTEFICPVESCFVYSALRLFS